MEYIRADLGSEGTQKALASVPLWFWFCASFFMLGIGVLGRLFMDRKTFASAISASDQSHDLVTDFEALELPKFIEKHALTFGRYVMNARDTYLQEVLVHQIKKYARSKHIIGVQYGAAHMDSLQSWLIKEYGYRIKSTQYMLAVANEVDAETDYLEQQYEESVEAYYDRMGELYYRRFPDEEKESGYEQVSQTGGNKLDLGLSPSIAYDLSEPVFVDGYKFNVRDKQVEFSKVETE